MSTTIATEMQQLILEEQLEIICDGYGQEHEEIAELEKEHFIEVIRPIRAENGLMVQR